MTDGEGDAVTEFRAELVRLYGRLHKPTYGKLKTYAAGKGRSLATSTTSNLLKGPGAPRWETVRTFVLACRDYAERNVPDAAASEFDLGFWRAAYDSMDQDDRPGDADVALRRRTDEWERRCERLVSLWPLPLVSDVDPFSLRVFRSQRAAAYRGKAAWPPYAGRDVDDRLRTAFRRHPFVLLEGPSRTGKSRTAYETLASVVPRRRLVVPVNRQSLTEIDRLDPPIFRDEVGVVLLDDIERFLGVDGDGLDTGMLARWERAGVKVLATIRFRERERLEKTIGNEVAGILAAARSFVLDYDLTPNERAEATRLYPGERFTRGLAEHLAGADELRAVFDRGVETSPAGYAVVRAAADRRRAGLPDPAPESALRELFDIYFALVRPVEPPSDDAFARGLQWGLQVIGDVTALLVRRGPEPSALEVSDVIVDHLDSAERARPVPTATWNLLLDRAEPAQVLAIGQTALTRDEIDVAADAFYRVGNGDDDELAGLGALQLGMLQQRDGDLEAAEQAYEVAIESGGTDAAPLASINLATLLEGRGDIDGAAALLADVIGGEARSIYTPAAQINLGILRAGNGDEAGALAAFTDLMRGCDPSVVVAMANLVAPAVAQSGDVETAKTMLSKVLEGGDPTDDLAPMVARAFLMAYGPENGIRGFIVGPERYGNAERSVPSVSLLGILRPGSAGSAAGLGFIRPTVTAADLPDVPNAVGDAHRALGQVQERSGDTDAALASYRLAKEAGTPAAALDMARIHGARGDSAESRSLLESVIRTPDQDLVAQALIMLGNLLEQDGDEPGAEAAYRRAMDTEHATAGPEAAAAFGSLLLRRDDFQGAKAPLESATYSDHPPAVALGGIALAGLELRYGDVETGVGILRHTATAGSGSRARLAAATLAVLLAPNAEVRSALQELQDAFKADADPGRGAAAALLIGIYLSRIDELGVAKNLLEWASESEQASADAATLALGWVYADMGDSRWAEALFRRAAGSSDTTIATGAAESLARLVGPPDSPDSADATPGDARSDGGEPVAG